MPKYEVVIHQIQQNKGPYVKPHRNNEELVKAQIKVSCVAYRPPKWPNKSGSYDLCSGLKAILLGSEAPEALTGAPKATPSLAPVGLGR